MLKYHSTPKPVRIRIESGGEEHFSLDSLLSCFNPGDLLGKRNELLRWLDFQGYEGKRISEELRTIEDLNQNVFGVYRAFFHQFFDENHIGRIEELYALWAKEKGKNFNYLKAFCYQDDFLIEKIFLSKKTSGLEQNWFGVISDFVEKNYMEKEYSQGVVGKWLREEIKNPNLLYYLGVFYKDKKDFRNAKTCLQVASDKGSKYNIERNIKEIEDSLLSQNRFYGINRDKVRDYISFIFNQWDSTWHDCHEMKEKCDCNEYYHLSDKETEIIELAFLYRKALTYPVYISHPSRRFQLIKSATKPKNENDFLKKEKDFIRCLSKYDEGNMFKEDGKREMKLLAMDYIPAKYMSNIIYKDKVLDEERGLRDKHPQEIIEFVLRHIFDFE